MSTATPMPALQRPYALAIATSIALLFTGALHAQDDARLARNVVHIDFGSLFFLNGGSINYERMLGDNASLRAGLGYGTWSFMDHSRQHLFGGILMGQYMTSGTNKLEFGAGVMLPVAGVGVTEHGEWSIRPLAATIGYRHQPATGGSMFRVGGSFIVNGEIGLHAGWGFVF